MVTDQVHWAGREEDMAVPVPVVEIHLLSQHLQRHAWVPPEGDGSSVAQQCLQQALQPLHSPQGLWLPGQLPLQALQAGLRRAVQGRCCVPHLPPGWPELRPGAGTWLPTHGHAQNQSTAQTPSQPTHTVLDPHHCAVGMTERVGGPMDAIAGLPIAVESHCDASAGEGKDMSTQPAAPPGPISHPAHLDRPCPAHLQTSVAMMTHQAVQQQSASRCSSLLRRRQHSQKE